LNAYCWWLFCGIGLTFFYYLILSSHFIVPELAQAPSSHTLYTGLDKLLPSVVPLFMKTPQIN
jgi:hypothetical protein